MLKKESGSSVIQKTAHPLSGTVYAGRGRGEEGANPSGHWARARFNPHGSPGYRRTDA